MGEKPDLRKRRRERLKQQARELGQDPSDNEDDGSIPTTLEQRKRLLELWEEQYDAEKQAGWGIGMMAIFVGLTSIVGVVYQIQSPWELQHFATLRPLVSSFELVVGLLPLTFSAILNGASIVCTSSSQNALLVLAVAIGCAGGLGWAIVFIWNGFFSWMHLWLPLLPPIYPGLAYLLITEVYASREELRRVEKLVFEHESA